MAQYGDLKVGVVPSINLEWIQKIHRDNAERGYSAEETVDTILSRMPDYINEPSITVLTLTKSTGVFSKLLK
jgi:phosphoribulokinase